MRKRARGLLSAVRSHSHSRSFLFRFDIRNGIPESGRNNCRDGGVETGMTCPYNDHKNKRTKVATR